MAGLLRSLCPGRRGPGRGGQPGERHPVQGTRRLLCPHALLAAPWPGLWAANKRRRCYLDLREVMLSSERRVTPGCGECVLPISLVRAVPEGQRASRWIVGYVREQLLVIL